MEREGKNGARTIRKSLEKSQFNVVDLSKGVPTNAFAAKAKKVNADIIVVSTNTTPAKENLQKRACLVQKWLKMVLILF